MLSLGNMTLNRVADLRRVGGLRYNFDTEQPTLLDIESVDCVTEDKRNSSGLAVNTRQPISHNPAVPAGRSVGAVSVGASSVWAPVEDI